MIFIHTIILAGLIAYSVHMIIKLTRLEKDRKGKDARQHKRRD